MAPKLDPYVKMTDAINRYRFTDKTVKQAINFLKGTAKTKPNFLTKFKGELKKNRLYLDGKKVIPKEKVEVYLRRRIYEAKTPLSRDAAFYWISKDAIGVGRAAIDKFLKSQRIVRETDRQQATSKRGSRKVHKKGQLHYDLIELKFKDLPFEPDDLPEEKKDSEKTEEELAEGERDPVHKGYVFSMVDALTSLSFFKFHAYKSHSEVTPIAREAFEFFSKMLDTPIDKFVGISDKGAEFSFKTYNKWGVKTVQVKSSPIVEGRNAFFQRVLYRIAKMKKTTNIHTLVKSAMKIVNRTQSSVTKKSPIENVKEKTSDVVEKYNKKKGKDSGIKIHRRKLVVGDKVRIQMVFKKDKGSFYKAYHGKMFSKRSYTVQGKRGNRYKVNGKFRHRDELRLTAEYDKKSEQLIKDRENE